MTLRQPVVLGIDLGGTKLLVAVVDSAGRIVEREKTSSGKSTAPEILTKIITLTESMRSRYADRGIDIAAVGIGVPGVVDTDTGHVLATANLPLDDTDLGRKVSDACGLPVVVGNDVTLSTMGEAWYGAGRGVSNLFGIFVGTGIGGGLVIDGKMYLGAHGGSGEVGHMQVDPDGPVCGCGRIGCLEALASRTAVERDIRDAVSAGRPSLLADRVAAGKRIRSARIQRVLEERDEVVMEVVRRAATTLGRGIGNVANLLDPDVIVVGGGLVQACGIFMMPKIVAAAEERMMPIPGGAIPIVSSRLGDDAGVLGAAALALEGLAARRPGGPSAYVPTVEWVAEGEVRINGERHVDDIVIREDGSLRKRRKKLSRRVFGTDSRVSIPELEWVCKGMPQALVIGIGATGKLQIGAEARDWLAIRGIRLVAEPSPNAVAEYRAMRGPRALLLHVRE